MTNLFFLIIDIQEQFGWAEFLKEFKKAPMGYIWFFSGIFLIVFLLYIIFISKKYSLIRRAYTWHINYMISCIFNNKVSRAFELLRVSDILYFVFLAILWKNTGSMDPYCWTMVSIFQDPFFYSAGCFFCIVSVALLKFGFSCISGFLPANTPKIIAPFLSSVEFVSVMSRLFSLGLRLLINLTGGHIVIKLFETIVAGSYPYIAGIFFPWFLLSIPGIFVLFALEFLACFLQALIMTSLMAIYINEAFEFIFH